MNFFTVCLCIIHPGATHCIECNTLGLQELLSNIDGGLSSQSSASWLFLFSLR